MSFGLQLRPNFRQPFPFITIPFPPGYAVQVTLHGLNWWRFEPLVLEGEMGNHPPTHRSKPIVEGNGGISPDLQLTVLLPNGFCFGVVCWEGTLAGAFHFSKQTQPDLVSPRLVPACGYRGFGCHFRFLFCFFLGGTPRRIRNQTLLVSQKVLFSGCGSQPYHT